jgi:thioredoxin reductase (NADPH)
MDKFDVIIVGGACAGLSAAIYTSRRSLKTLVLTKDLGGQAAITTEIENYPGTGVIAGPALVANFKSQAEKAGAEIRFGVLTAIEKNGESFIVKSSLGDFEADAVILAFGLKHRELGLGREQELIGHGISYCATCDGPLFRGKEVAIVGAGNSAFDAAEYLSTIASKVYLIHRSEEFRAEAVLINAVKNIANIEMIVNTEITALVGEKKLERLILKNNKTGAARELAVNGLFVEIGWMTQTDLVKDVVNLNDRGYIVIDNEGKTSMPGIFAAGDITDTPYKQAVISAGEGARAGLSAAKFLQMKRGQANAVAPDWTRRKK